MLTKKQIGSKLIEAVKKIIEEEKKNESDRDVSIHYGFAIGLITALGITIQLKDLDDPIDYFISVIEDICFEPKR